MQIHILGAGWVGLVTAAAFACNGHEVIVRDVDKDRIALLRRGEIPFFEEGLLALLQEGVAANRISFSHVDESVSAPDIIFCAVGTPQGADGHADLSAVIASAKMAEEQFPLSSFVIKSTVPPGTCAKLATQFPHLFFASNPEFLAEGTAVHDALMPSRIVFGTQQEEARQRLFAVYKPWQERGTPIIATNCVTSELAKYAANAFLATKISFVNEISEFSEAVDADMRTISESMGFDLRIGSRFLAHGLGYGGSCFPKDTQALLAVAHELGIALPIVHEAEQRNIRQRARFIERIITAFVAAGSQGHVAVLGVSYKPGTDDIRSSPAIAIINSLREKKIPLRWFDPRVLKIEGDAERAAGLVEACEGASVVFVATAWLEIMEYAQMLPQERVIWGR